MRAWSDIFSPCMFEEPLSTLKYSTQLSHMVHVLSLWLTYILLISLLRRAPTLQSFSLRSILYNILYNVWDIYTDSRQPRVSLKYCWGWGFHFTSCVIWQNQLFLVQLIQDCNSAIVRWPFLHLHIQIYPSMQQHTYIYRHVYILYYIIYNNYVLCMYMCLSHNYIIVW